uniref:Pyrroline-5-carboxylate reductase n=1 Tax=Toxoplasma gondii COUG TaxID=1074873 RepID=A0A2G8Y204_TOXGO|nr:pyrroline-5-carboxylate reductase [Toxoplasma gondii COUG]
MRCGTILSQTLSLMLTLVRWCISHVRTTVNRHLWGNAKRLRGERRFRSHSHRSVVGSKAVYKKEPGCPSPPRKCCAPAASKHRQQDENRMTERIRKKIAFIGAGTMAFALAKGFTSSKRVLPSEITMLVRNEAARNHAIENGYLAVHTLEELDPMDIIFISVTATEALDLVRSFAPVIDGSHHLIISISIGVSLSKLVETVTEEKEKHGQKVEGNRRIARLLPNVACQSGHGVSVFCLGPDCSHDDGHTIMNLLTTCGVCYRIEERYMDASAALAGSGPAFVFMLLDALSDAGVKNGLPRVVASSLAIDMVKGSAGFARAKQSVKTLGELKEETILPGGATITGLTELDRHGFVNSVIQAVEQCMIPADPDTNLL